MPYRESVLTKIIFEHLNKNIQINFILTFDPNHKHYEDNIRVLEFSNLGSYTLRIGPLSPTEETMR